MSYLLLFLPFLFIIGFRVSQKFQEPLNKEDEESYLKLYTETKDEKAREILIERNLRLVVNIAKKYDNNKTEFEDLISIGIIGLIKGINTFKIEKENKLSTYVSRCIENEILMHLRKIKKQKEEVLMQDCYSQDKDGNELTLMDTIIVDAKDLSDIAYDNINLNKVKEFFGQVLTEEEQYIIKKRFGIFGCERKTQFDIAEKLNISRSYVSRIEARALKKLRKAIQSTEDKKNIGKRLT